MNMSHLCLYSFGVTFQSCQLNTPVAWFTSLIITAPCSPFLQLVLKHPLLQLYLIDDLSKQVGFFHSPTPLHMPALQSGSSLFIDQDPIQKLPPLWKPSLTPSDRVKYPSFLIPLLIKHNYTNIQIFVYLLYIYIYLPYESLKEEEHAWCLFVFLVPEHQFVE